jgi:hypothetical protein
MKKSKRFALQIIDKLFSENLKNELEYQKEMLDLSPIMMENIDKEIGLIAEPIFITLIEYFGTDVSILHE